MNSGPGLAPLEQVALSYVQKKGCRFLYRTWRRSRKVEQKVSPTTTKALRGVFRHFYECIL